MSGEDRILGFAPSGVTTDCGGSKPCLIFFHRSRCAFAILRRPAALIFAFGLPVSGGAAGHCSYLYSSKEHFL
jgi:hypothetical protein